MPYKHWEWHYVYGTPLKLHVNQQEREGLSLQISLKSTLECESVFPPSPWLYCCYTPSTMFTNHPLCKYPPCALFQHLVKPQFCHLWRLLTISSQSEGINIVCGVPFPSRTCAWLAWLPSAREHRSEASYQIFVWNVCTLYIWINTISYLYINGAFKLFPS